MDKDTPESLSPPLTIDVLLTTLRNNARSLRHLRALCPSLDTRNLLWRSLNCNFGQPPSTAVLDNLLRAAPGLKQVEVDISVAAFDSSLFHNGVVCVRRLIVDDPRPASCSAFLADARRCSSLSELQLIGGLDAGNVEALLDFALNKPLTALGLPFNLTPATMPLLTRFLSEGSLTTLEVWYTEGELAPLPTFCAAVAAAPLVRLYYAHAGLFDTLTAGLSLLAAVTGHPTLRHLALSGNPVTQAGRAAVGAALGLLVAADSPLITLDIKTCGLGNDGLLPFIDALPVSDTRLLHLICEENEFTQLTATRLLAAVRAKASLINLSVAIEVWGYTPGERILIPDELIEAEALVYARARRGVRPK